MATTYFNSSDSLKALYTRGNGSPTNYDCSLARVYNSTIKNSPYGSWSIPDTVIPTTCSNYTSGNYSCYSTYNDCSSNNWFNKMIGSFSAQGADFTQGYENFNKVSSDDLFGGLGKMGIANILQPIMTNPFGAFGTIISSIGSWFKALTS